jgi:hypothetical protein
VTTSRVTGNGIGVVRAVITRADGTIEDLGVISASSVRFWQIKKRLILRAMKNMGN